MTPILDTSGMGPDERFQRWADICARDLEPLALRRDRERPFAIRVHRFTVGPLRVVRLRADAHVAERTPATIRAADPEMFHLMLQVHGRCSIEQDDRAAVADPGHLVSWQSSRPYAIEGLEPFEALIVECPARLLAQGIGRRTAESLQSTTGVGQLARHHLTCLFDSGLDRAMAAQARSLLARSAVDLIRALYAAEPESGAPRPGSAEALRQDIAAYIEANLGDPDLDPGSIARAMPISPGYLHRLFAAESTTVCGMIRARRLERCRHDLLDPAFADEPIARIAMRWGFVSAAHFSRAFRAAYGASPSEVRCGAVSTTAPAGAVS
jgi:AraC-like DNA-binding protein